MSDDIKIPFNAGWSPGITITPDIAHQIVALAGFDTDLAAERERREKAEDALRGLPEVVQDAMSQIDALRIQNDELEAKLTAYHEEIRPYDLMCFDYVRTYSLHSELGHTVIESVVKDAVRMRAEIAEAHKTLPNNIPFKNGTLAGRIGFVLARDEANARAEVAALRARKVTLPGIKSGNCFSHVASAEADGFNRGVEACADAIKASGIEVES